MILDFRPLSNSFWVFVFPSCALPFVLDILRGLRYTVCIVTPLAGSLLAVVEFDSMKEG